MSLLNRWGSEEYQKKFFERQIRYRATLRELASDKGSEIIAENALFFRLSNQVKQKEDMIRVAISRYIFPVLKNGWIVMPQIFGASTIHQTMTIYSYAPILKFLKGKTTGLVDVLMLLLGRKECDLFGFISGVRECNGEQLAAVAAFDIRDRTRLLKAFTWRDGDMVECMMPLERYEEIFSRTFDSDIWVDKDALKGQ